MTYIMCGQITRVAILLVKSESWDSGNATPRRWMKILLIFLQWKTASRWVGNSIWKETFHPHQTQDPVSVSTNLAIFGKWISGVDLVCSSLNVTLSPVALWDVQDSLDRSWRRFSSENSMCTLNFHFRIPGWDVHTEFPQPIVTVILFSTKSSVRISVNIASQHTNTKSNFMAL